MNLIVYFLNFFCHLDHRKFSPFWSNYLLGLPARRLIRIHLHLVSKCLFAQEQFLALDVGIHHLHNGFVIGHLPMIAGIRPFREVWLRASCGGRRPSHRRRSRIGRMRTGENAVCGYFNQILHLFVIYHLKGWFLKGWILPPLCPLRILRC